MNIVAEYSFHTHVYSSSNLFTIYSFLSASPLVLHHQLANTVCFFFPSSFIFNLTFHNRPFHGNSFSIKTLIFFFFFWIGKPVDKLLSENYSISFLWKILHFKLKRCCFCFNRMLNQLVYFSKKKKKFLDLGFLKFKVNNARRFDLSHVPFYCIIS